MAARPAISAHEVKGKMRQAEGAAQDLYGQAKDALSDAARIAQDSAVEARDVVREIIEERPYTVAIAALAVGFCIGRMGATTTSCRTELVRRRTSNVRRHAHFAIGAQRPRCAGRSKAKGLSAFARGPLLAARTETFVSIRPLTQHVTIMSPSVDRDNALAAASTTLPLHTIVPKRGNNKKPVDFMFPFCSH